MFLLSVFLTSAHMTLVFTFGHSCAQGWAPESPRIKNGRLANLASNPLVTVPMLELWAKWVKNSTIRVLVAALLSCEIDVASGPFLLHPVHVGLQSGNEHVNVAGRTVRGKLVVRDSSSFSQWTWNITRPTRHHQFLPVAQLFILLTECQWRRSRGSSGVN